MWRIWKNRPLEVMETDEKTDKNVFKVQPRKKTEYNSKLRVLNKKYNTIGVTIPKDIVSMINLKQGDLMVFKIISEDENSVAIDISFKKQ